MEYQEGIDYIVDHGLWVWTSEFLLKRGYCCGNGCKNCPYQSESESLAKNPPENP